MESGITRQVGLVDKLPCPSINTVKALPRPGAQVHIDDDACASYCFDASSKTMVSYDTPEIAKRKAHFIKKHHLGGAMWWESSGDKNGHESLIDTVSLECPWPSSADY